MMKFLIFGTPECKYCDQAKSLLNEREISYSYYNLNAIYPDNWRTVLTDLDIKAKGIPLVFQIKAGLDLNLKLETPEDIRGLKDVKYIGGFFELEDKVEEMEELTVNSHY